MFEQATQECRNAIAPRKNKGLQDWLRVCRELGGPLTNAGLAAAIIQSQRQAAPKPEKRTCFNCGKPGHLKRDCRVVAKAPPELCPRCGKGYHKAELCRSVRDIKGRLLSPSNLGEPKNEKRGPWSQGPKKFGTQFVQEGQYTPQNLEKPDWMCTPPPASY